ncbi:MAG: aminotransferase class V-fold PLP-dependent enzyme [Planctomycetota bacterium]|nr:aminotransferase class V-fold PLP-dependent enzyme [Planctomycetota bacterium]
MSQEPAFYCDFNAGAPVEPDVLERFLVVERDVPGNPASVHGPGRRARAVLETARERIAAALRVDVDDVLFTSGGTESANLAVHGLGDPRLPVLLSEAEHPAVMEPARARGIVRWRVDDDGAACVEDPGCAVGLVCLVHAQSELGTLQPVAQAAVLSKQLGVPMFVDAAQSLGRVPLDAALDAADALALSPHKCGGLRGHGVLVVRDAAARLRPLLRGGGQEQALRPGTQSPALAAANALAIERAVREQPERATNMASTRAAFLRGLCDSAAEHRVLTPLERSVPNTVMIALPHLEGRNLLPALDLSGIHASHGAACSSGSPTPPQILMALGMAEHAARACVRFSFGFRDSLDAAERAGRRVGDVVAALQKKN